MWHCSIFHLISYQYHKNSFSLEGVKVNNTWRLTTSLKVSFQPFYYTVAWKKNSQHSLYSLSIWRTVWEHLVWYFENPRTKGCRQQARAGSVSVIRARLLIILKSSVHMLFFTCKVLLCLNRRLSNNKCSFICQILGILVNVCEMKFKFI